MKHTIFLHGALGVGRQLQTLADKLQGSFHKHVYTFSGHGGKPLNPDTFSVQGFASEVLAYMDEQGINKAVFFGYSLGGYVAMYLAQQHPERVERLSTLGTKWYWDTATAAKEAGLLNPEGIEAKVPAFAEVLKTLHAPTNWKEIVKLTAKLMTDIGANPPVSLKALSAVETPVLLCLGDEDNMVPLAETEEVCELLSNGSLMRIPQTRHQIDRANLHEVAAVLQGWLAEATA